MTGRVRVKAKAPDGSGVDWLLLDAEGASGPSFAGVNILRRVDTVGGKAPDASSAPCTLGETRRVEYRATYELFVRREITERDRRSRSSISNGLMDAGRTGGSSLLVGKFEYAGGDGDVVKASSDGGGAGRSAPRAGVSTDLADPSDGEAEAWDGVGVDAFRPS